MSGPDAAAAEPTKELVASRARILARADEGRRQLQRELHDGAQQRLVHALIVVVVELVRVVVERTKAERIDLNLDLDGELLVVETRYLSEQCLAREPGDGLTGVRDRVCAAGGALDVLGLAGGGTSVRARLPVRADIEATVRGATGA